MYNHLIEYNDIFFNLLSSCTEKASEKLSSGLVSQSYGLFLLYREIFALNNEKFNIVKIKKQFKIELLSKCQSFESIDIKCGDI